LRHGSEAPGVQVFTASACSRGISRKTRRYTVEGRTEMSPEMNNGQGRNMAIWIGVGIGAAVGIGIALSRRKRTPWDSARDISKRVASHSGDLAESTRDIVDRVRNIYEEGCKLVDEAGELWSHGRKLVTR
jgi:hypothetical protein